MDERATEMWIGRGLRNFARTWEHVARAMDGATVRWDDTWACNGGLASPFANNATLMRPVGAAELPELTARLDAFYGDREGRPWLLWASQPNLDLWDLGFYPSGRPPLMLRLPGGDPPAVPPSLRIVEVEDAAALVAFERAHVEGFPLGFLLPFRPRSLFDDRVLGGPFRLWVGYVGHRPVSCALAYVDEEIVGVHCVSTIREARGRGYGAALSWTATLAQPELPAMLHSTPMGRPMYEAMGYRDVARTTIWERDRQTGRVEGSASERPSAP